MTIIQTWLTFVMGVVLGVTLSFGRFVKRESASDELLKSVDTYASKDLVDERDAKKSFIRHASGHFVCPDNETWTIDDGDRKDVGQIAEEWRDAYVARLRAEPDGQTCDDVRQLGGACVGKFLIVPRR